MIFIDAVLSIVYAIVDFSVYLWEAYKVLTLGKFPHSSTIFLASNAINAATTVFAAAQGNPPFYWLHSLLLVLFGTTGGGIVSPTLIGKPSSICTNELIIPIIVVTWYAVHNLGFYGVLDNIAVKIVWKVLLGLFRTHSVISMTNLAFATLSATDLYPIPLLGPIIVGTVNGCFGGFLPYDRGLSPIANGTSWIVQGSFITAVTYHLIVNDKSGFIGNTFRAIVGSYSEQETRIILATIHIATNLLQTFFSPEANLFTPFHKFLYLVFQVTGPVGAHTKKSDDATVGWDYYARLALEKIIESSRILVVLAVIIIQLYISQPSAYLLSGQFLKAGDVIGSCQLLSSVQRCSPLLFTLDSQGSGNYRLGTYRGQGKRFVPSASDAPVWLLNLKLSTKVKVDPEAEKGVILGEDGVLRFIARSEAKKQDDLLWASSSKCPVEAVGTKSIFLGVEKSGSPVIRCADGSVIPLL